MTPDLLLAWQFCQSGLDITNQIHAEHDADEARAWDADFCMVALERDGYDPDRWRITSTDACLPDQADRQLFAHPTAALDYLAEHLNLTYELTTTQRKPD